MGIAEREIEKKKESNLKRLSSTITDESISARRLFYRKVRHLGDERGNNKSNSTYQTQVFISLKEIRKRLAF